VSVDDERWEILLPHRAAAVSAVRRATGSIAEAEDVVHDAMLRIVGRADLDPTRVRSLLIRTALQIASAHHRAAVRQRDALVRLRGGADSAVASPEQVHADRVEAQRAVAVIAELPRRERQVLLLRIGGLTVMETAERLGLSAKSVEGAYTRARARMRLLAGSMLAWLAERLRRATPTRRDATASTVAAVLLLAPGCRPDDGPAPQPSTTALRPPIAARSPTRAGLSPRHGVAPRDRPLLAGPSVGLVPVTAPGPRGRAPGPPRPGTSLVDIPAVLTLAAYVAADPGNSNLMQRIQGCMARAAPWTSLEEGPCQR